MKIERVVEEKLSSLPAGDYEVLSGDGSKTVKHFEARDVFRVEYLCEVEVGPGAEAKLEATFAHLFRCDGFFADACGGGSFYVTALRVGPNNFCERTGAVPLPTFTKEALGQLNYGTVKAGDAVEVKVHNEAATPGVARFRIVGREMRLA